MHAQTIAFDRASQTPERLARWSEFVRCHIGDVEADTFGDPQFNGRIAVARHGETKLFGLAVSPHRVLRTPAMIRRDPCGYLKITAQLEGVACFEQAGRSLTLRPGEWSIYDATRTYAVTNAVPIRQAAIFLPRERLQHLDLERITVRRFTAAGEAGRGVRDLLLRAQVAMQGSAGLPDDLGERLADLVGRSVHEHEASAIAGTGRGRFRQQALDFIAANLRDPALDLDTVAAALGCSKRYLHKLFESEAETLAASIWRQRLEQVSREFADPAQRRRTITDIAFSWGFSSSSHFSRLFSDSFGVSPRRFRAASEGRG